MGRNWSKGLTFEQIHGARAPDVRKTLSEKLKGKTTGRASTNEFELERRRKISESMKKNPKAGGYRRGSGVGKKCWFESKFAGTVFLDSSYELAYAKFLDANNIKWHRNTQKFPYEWEGKTRYYIPDFFIETENLFVELKGYRTEKDKAKWKNFPFKLRILFGKDLKELGILDGSTQGG